MSLPYHHVKREDGAESVVVILPDGPPVVANDDHPHFEEILDGLLSESLDAEDVRELADLSVAASRRFDRLSERVAVSDGRVFFDGAPADEAITRQIVRALDAGLRDWKPLVRFMENLAANPVEHSRDQLYAWLRDRNFTITEDGGFIAYKGVNADYGSITRGPAIVDGEAVNGHVPNCPGSTVEIARSSVAFNPAQGCASGLHAGTYDYAHRFARGAVLKVEVNPRDVVSVPTDCDAAKLRTCRYVVLACIDAPSTAVIDYDAAAAKDQEFCERCGEQLDDLFDCDCD